MNTTAHTPSAQAAGHATLPADAPASARTVFRMLDKLAHGRLDIQWPDGRHSRFPAHAPDTATSLRATICLNNWRVFERTMKSGDIGFAESFIDGDWHTPDLTALLSLFIANRDHLEQIVYGSWWGSLLYRVKHWLNRNSRTGSAKNIHAHYDLGNDFYRMWLDPSMNYSSAWFEGRSAQELAGHSLQEAQQAKMRRALDEAGVQAGSRVLEIGCGWGAIAETAAKERSAHVTGVTLSKEQLAWAQDRMAKGGLSQQADLRYQDYRDLVAQHEAQPFDAIVSIEMFEAVGREYWDSYFDTIKRCLKPGGRACIQTITIRDDLFDRYVKSTDFIQQYIFPGGLLPSPSQFEAMARKAGLVVDKRLAFGPDYAETLRRWRDAFLQREADVGQLGFDTRFVRIWTFYLAYCEAAFDHGNTDVMQFTLRRPA
ncbi:MAG: class I SAM-dependent methyltransferase [Aquabacterium sp.]|uniref:SAM-dependent methyltransferase n=1 Tax=Aquabacterium sp. TaxID=1872578 RepID=UPI0025B80251|nr:cyclopropane-fatty-acyl-phospholipid synthase family protein [Aquabacterium sp.]MBI5924450.1 class I SAM-dependent methyltransferase [Aquabacterium sp.]